MNGDSNDIAIFKFFHPISDIDNIRASYPILVRNEIKGEIPFNSAYKFIVTLHEPLDFAPRDHENDCAIFMKGAPEVV